MPTNQSGFASVIVAKIGNVKVDAVLNELHRFDSTITENPVEDGTIYSDHVILHPVSYEMTGRVTDASLSLLDLRAAGTAADAFSALVTLQRTTERFTLVTGINVYENMILEGLSFPRRAEDGRSIRFDCVVREILVVGDEAATNRDRIAGDVQHSALPYSAKGVVAKVPVL